MGVERHCVFCGKPPRSKNREHVIPQWVMRMTGKPGRKVRLGRDWSKPGAPIRTFSFDSFAFPACEACNTKYSGLEARVQRVVGILCDGGSLGTADFDDLLDWLDKVRTGLWLGFRYLNADHLGVHPRFAIEDRVARHDRLVFVYRDAEPMKGLAFVGTESPIFQVMPSCLYLMVNGVHLFNVSAASLFSPRLGFPAPINRRLSPDMDAGYEADVQPGTKRVELPLVPFRLRDGGALIFQPMVPHTGSSVAPPEFKDAYLATFIHEHTRRGRIFHVHGGALKLIPDAPSLAWCPLAETQKFPVLSDLTRMNLEWQDALYRLEGDVSLEALSEAQRSHVEGWRELILKHHADMTASVCKQMDEATHLVRL